jgi:hypothetical protein
VTAGKPTLIHGNLGKSNKHCGPRNPTREDFVTFGRAVYFAIFIKELSLCSPCASAQALKYLQLTRRAFRRLRSRPWTVAMCSTSNSAHSGAITARPVTRSLAAGPRRDATETA